MADQSPDPGYQIGLTGVEIETRLGLANTATQPGDNLNTLGSGAEPTGRVPHADGAGNVAWQLPAGAVRLLATFKNGTPAANEVVLRFVAPAAGTTLPSGLSDSRAAAKVAATAEAVFPITHDGAQVGTMTFAAAATVATFAMAANTVMGAGDMLEVVAPATPDATLADLGITLYGLQSS
jgi:hypothetical protein